MIFKVMNREEARKFSQKESPFPYIIISISCSDGEHPQFEMSDSLRDILYLFFDDVTKADFGYVPISTEAAQAAVRFVKKYESIPLVIVHCDAGISRSAGVCAGLMKVFTGSDTAIFRNPRYCPNMKCYREILNCAEGVLKEETSVAVSEGQSDLEETKHQLKVLTIQSHIFHTLCDLEEAFDQAECICDGAPRIEQLQSQLTCLKIELADLLGKEPTEISSDLKDYEGADSAIEEKKKQSSYKRICDGMF